MSAACEGWVLHQWKIIQVKFINVTTCHTLSSPGQLLGRQPHLAHPWACQGQQSSHTKVWPNLNSDELLPPKFLVLYWFWRDHLWATIITDPSWLPNQMISLVLLFGFLCRSSSWWPWPHIGGGRLFWRLLRPQMALLGHFFCKIYFLWVWRRKAFFGGSCRSLFLSLGRYFVGPLNG